MQELFSEEKLNLLKKELKNTGKLPELYQMLWIYLQQWENQITETREKKVRLDKLRQVIEVLEECNEQIPKKVKEEKKLFKRQITKCFVKACDFSPKNGMA